MHGTTASNQTISSASNKAMLDDAKVRGQKVITIAQADAGKNVLAKKPDEVRRELTAADELRSLLVKLDDNERNGPPLYMRFGMYSGDRVYKQQLLPIYMGMIEQRFKAPTIRRVEGGPMNSRSAIAASLAMLASFAVSATVVWQLVGLPAEQRSIEQVIYTWLASDDFTLPLAFHLDPLSAVMILVVTGIGSLTAARSRRAGRMRRLRWEEVTLGWRASWRCGGSPQSCPRSR